MIRCRSIRDEIITRVRHEKVASCKIRVKPATCNL